MDRQNETKELIASSFKYLVCNKPIDKISITDIMNQANFRRQTFYDYFDDKYDLVTWIFLYEITELTRSSFHWENWEQVLFLLLNYLEKNKKYYKKLFLNVKLDSFKDYFTYTLKQGVQHLADEYFEQNNQIIEQVEMTEVTINFYAYGLSQLLHEWVLGGCLPPSDAYHKLLTQVIHNSSHF